MNIFARYKEYYKNYGLIKTLLKIICKPFRYLNKKKAYINFVENKKKILNLNSLKDKFTYIYSSNYWPSKESVSGPGSELENTKNIRKEIINLINKYEFKTILDAPCGDFNWIKHIIIKKDVQYIGADIVSELISKNKKKYSYENIKFIEIDIVNEKLPSADLLICRDFFIHLSTLNIKKFFYNILNSNIKYFLFTSYEFKRKTNAAYNINIFDGDFRPIFLKQNPFNLPEPILKILDKEKELKNNQDLSCYLYLYSKEQIKH